MTTARLWKSLVTTITCLGLCASASAQDLRVYTTVTDLSRGPENARIIAHNLTLFHNGKVYDFMEENGVVVIFEPLQHRFMLLAKDFTATEVSFAEIHQFLESAQNESQRFIEKLAARNDAEAAKQAAAIRFQFEPEFHEAFDPAQQILTLNGGSMNYSVKTAKAPQDELVGLYLDYTDWAARLNYVLYPHSVFPETRLRLDQALRTKNLLPTQVDRLIQDKDSSKLRAEHTFAWEFQSADMKSISHWERALNSSQTRWVTFHEYQKQQLTRKSP